MHTHEDLAAAEGSVEVRVLQAGRGIEDAIAVLDRAESAAGVPLVDEAERARLQALAAGRREREEHWHSLLARHDGAPMGYAGVVVPPAGGDAGAATGLAGEPREAVADLAAVQDELPRGEIVAALLSGVEWLGWQHGAERVEVWIRHADVEDVGCAVDHGFGIERRLGVLGIELDAPVPDPEVPDGYELRRFQPGRDEDAVVAVLRAAYRGTPEGGWSTQRLAQRTSYDWFRPEDLLLLEGAGGPAGIHWTKRRGRGVGECYNLAVHPDQQGRGLGAVLLRAGLAHLRRVGCREVLLWVDLSNERAVRLYTSHGFRTRWEDLALSRSLRRPPR